MEHSAVGSLFPSLTYADAAQAIDWLCAAFGFTRRLVVPGEQGQVRHSELSFQGAVIMVSSPKADQGRVAPGDRSQTCTALSLYVEDPDAHHERATRAGAEIVHPLKDEEYGARGYMARDPEGYLWYFGNYRPGAWWQDGEGSPS